VWLTHHTGRDSTGVLHLDRERGDKKGRGERRGEEKGRIKILEERRGEERRVGRRFSLETQQMS
jgi:hypothetical protein